MQQPTIQEYHQQIQQLEDEIVQIERMQKESYSNRLNSSVPYTASVSRKHQKAEELTYEIQREIDGLKVRAYDLLIEFHYNTTNGVKADGPC